MTWYAYIDIFQVVHASPPDIYPTFLYPGIRCFFVYIVHYGSLYRRRAFFGITTEQVDRFFHIILHAIRSLRF